MDDAAREKAIRLVAHAFVATVKDKSTSRLQPKTRLEMLVVTTMVRETLYHMQGDSRSTPVAMAWTDAARQVDAAADEWWREQLARRTATA